MRCRSSIHDWWPPSSRGLFQPHCQTDIHCVWDSRFSVPLPRDPIPPSFSICSYAWEVSFESFSGMGRCHLSLVIETLLLVSLRFTRCLRMDSPYNSFWKQLLPQLLELRTQITGRWSLLLSLLFLSKQKATGEARWPSNSELQERPGPDIPAMAASHTPDLPFLPAAPTMPTPQVRESASERLRDFSKVTQLKRIIVDIQTPRPWMNHPPASYFWSTSI